MQLQKLISSEKFVFTFFFFVGSLITWLLGVYSGFFVSLNDFWTVLYYGRHMTWAHPESLYNAFYPFGYAFIIGQLPYTYAIQLSYLINAFLSGLFVASVSTLISLRGTFLFTVLAFIFSVLEPLIFQYSNTPGPDIGAAAFPAFALYLLWRDAFGQNDKVNSTSIAILIGVSLGFAFLWRTHLLFLAVIVIILGILFARIQTKHLTVVMVIALGLVVSIQVMVDVISGHHPFETGQMFNVHKLLFGLDWNNPPSPQEVEKFSFLQLILTNPQRILNAAWPYFQYLISFASTGFALFLISPKGHLRNFGLFSLITVFVYSVPLSISDSPRAPLAIMSFYLSALALTFVAIFEKLSILKFRLWIGSLAIFVCIALSYAWFHTDITFISENHVSFRVFSNMEQVLLKNGLTSPNEVFSNRYSYYLPTRPPYITRNLANWSRDWMWGYVNEYPEVDMDSWESFRQSCLEQGIRFIVITPQAAEQADFFATLYENEFDEEQMGIEFIGQRATSRMFKFK